MAMIDGTYESASRAFQSEHGSTIRALAGPVDVVVRPALGQSSRVCTPADGDA